MIPAAIAGVLPLLESAGNQNKTAALKMSRQALAYQIRELGILVRG